MNEFNNPLTYQTNAFNAQGSILYSLCQFRDLGKSIERAREWAVDPKHAKKGYFSQVMTSKGEILFDSRKA